MTQIEASRALSVPLKREPCAEGLRLPEYATCGAAGLDICAAIPDESPVTLAPGQRASITTGVRIALPSGYEAQVRPRSGLALRHGIGLVNAPGTIDSDFTGVIQIILINWGDAPYTIHRGDRIAQLVVAPVTRVCLVEARELDATARGDGGFGSTGHGMSVTVSEQHSAPDPSMPLAIDMTAPPPAMFVSRESGSG